MISVAVLAVAVFRQADACGVSYTQFVSYVLYGMVNKETLGKFA